MKLQKINTVVTSHLRNIGISNSIKEEKGISKASILNDMELKNASDCISNYSKASLNFKGGASKKVELISEDEMRKRLSSVYDDEDFVEETIDDIQCSVYESYQKKLANKFFSDERLYGNENIAKIIGNIIDDSDLEEQANIRIAIMDKYINIPDSKEKKVLAKYIGDIIYYCHAEKRIEIVDRLISNKKFYGNEDITKAFIVLLNTIHDSEDHITIINAIDAINAMLDLLDDKNS